MKKNNDQWKSSFSNEDKKKIFLFCQKFVSEKIKGKPRSLISLVTKSLVDHFFQTSDSKATFLQSIQNMGKSLTDTQFNTILKKSSSEHVRGLLNFFHHNVNILKELISKLEAQVETLNNTLRSGKEKHTEEVKMKIVRSMTNARNRKGAYLGVINMTKMLTQPQGVEKIAGNAGVVRNIELVKRQLTDYMKKKKQEQEQEQEQKKQQKDKNVVSNETVRPPPPIQPKLESQQPPKKSGQGDNDKRKVKSETPQNNTSKPSGDESSDIVPPPPISENDEKKDKKTKDENSLTLDEFLERIHVPLDSIIPHIPPSHWVENTEHGLFYDENFPTILKNDQNDDEEEEEGEEAITATTTLFFDDNYVNWKKRKRGLEIYSNDETIMKIIPKKKKRKISHHHEEKEDFIKPPPLLQLDILKHDNNEDEDLDDDEEDDDDGEEESMKEENQNIGEEEEEEERKKKELENRIFPSVELESIVMWNPKKKKKKKMRRRRRRKK